MLTLVIFDLDGTLVDFCLDFNQLKREIAGKRVEGTLLEYISSLEGVERELAEEALKAHELKAAGEVELLPHARELLSRLDSMGIKKALFTRNNRQVVEILREKFNLSFDAVSTREDGRVKPSSAQVARILKETGVGAQEALVVGDHEFDLVAAREAGVRVALLEGRFSFQADKADFSASNLKEVEEVILRLAG